MSATEKKLPGPCSERQLMYFNAEQQADVTLYGGAAGSGKSEIGVIDFLKYTDVPNFIGVMTRRTTPQLNGPGGLLTKCKRIFSQAYEPGEYTWRAKDGKFVFHHSGAEIYLKHFENDQADINWQGTEANLFYVDEGTQFTQHMIQYIMSRMRNPSCPSVQPHLKITCNPDADHFLRKWVEPYLQEDGTPDRSKDGMIRYFSFQDGDFVWADSKEQLMGLYGIPEEDCVSFTFISATVRDNPIVQKINPKYVAWLKGLKGVERARLLDGNWKVREEGTTYFKRGWVEEVAYIDPSEIVATVRTFDFAMKQKSDSEPSPDYTVSTLMHKLKDGRYAIAEVKRGRYTTGKWLSFILECCEGDTDRTQYYLPLDPGVGAKRSTDLLVKDLAENGIYAKTLTTNKSKLDRFRPFSAVAEKGFVVVVTGCCTDYENGVFADNGFFYKELEAFTGERKRGESGHDDMVDTVSDGFYVLAKEKDLGNFASGMAGFAGMMKSKPGIL